MRGPINGFRGHAVTLTVAVAVAFAFVAGLLDLRGALPGLDRSYEVSATLPTAASLAPGARVTMAGVDVGRVAAVERRGLGVRVELDLTDDRVTPLPVNSRVAVAQRTPVGENYVRVVRGSSRRTLPSGGILPISQADEYTDVDQVLSTLDGDTRDRARAFLQSTGEGIDGRGEQFNHVLDDSAVALRNIATITRALHPERSSLAAVVTHLGSLSRSVSERGESIRVVARESRTAFGVLADRDDELAAVLRELPGLLAQARGTSVVLDHSSKQSTPVLTQLARAIAELRPAFARLPSASASARTALLELGRASTPLRGALRSVRATSPPAAKALPALGATLCQANPTVRYLAPYIDDLNSMFGGLGSSTNSYDATGHLIRVSPIVSEQELVGVPDAVHRAANALLSAGVLGQLRRVGYNAYPAAGTVGAPGGGDGAVGPKDSKARFPRIQADC